MSHQSDEFEFENAFVFWFFILLPLTIPTYNKYDKNPLIIPFLILNCIAALVMTCLNYVVATLRLKLHD